MPKLLQSHEAHVQDRVPERGKKTRPAPPGKALILHIPTLEWAEESSRKLLELTANALRNEGRLAEAAVADFLLVKVQGMFLREYETQRKGLGRRTKRDKEKIENEMRMTKLRAQKLMQDLALIDRTQAKIDEKTRAKRTTSHWTIEGGDFEFVDPGEKP
jgi:hypothetical protein